MEKDTSGFNIELYFMNQDRSYHLAETILTSEELRSTLKPTHGKGMIRVESDLDGIIIEDDFEWIRQVFLVEAPEKLSKGQGFDFEHRYSPDVFLIRVQDGVVSFDDGDGILIYGAVDDVIAKLKALAKLDQELADIGFQLM